MPDVEIRVLGPLRVTVDGMPIEIAGPLPRRLLALLASSAGRAVPFDRITDALWRGAPPSGATQTLQSHVARLRRQLPDGAVETCPEGYRLHAAVDADAFERALARDDTDSLFAVLEEWRGPAYDGLVDDGELARESARLASLRTEAVCQVTKARLASNRLEGLQPLIESELRRQPIREQLWELLMLLLYRQGRQAEALAAYQQARLALREELGVDPGAGLRELEHRILTRDPHLMPRADHADSSSQRRRVAVLVLEPLDASDEAAEHLAAERRTVYELITSHGGIALPSPGALLFTAFGIPRAHEDDPLRALNAGRKALGRALARRAGLATGLGVVDEAGDLVPGSAVARRAEALCLASKPGRFGTDDQTKAVLTAARGAEPSRFVGRQLDLAELDDEFQRCVARSRSQLVTLVGEAGMGKSRLAREFLQMLPPGVHVASVRCPAYGEATGSDVIARLVGRDVNASRPSLYDAFRFGFDELERAAGGRPQVLHVDDLHWADDLLVDFLRGLVESAVARPLLLMVGTRPELATSRPDWGSWAPAARTLRLGRLSHEETEELVRDLGGDESVVARTGGVPLYALELSRIDGDAIPDSLRSVVAARIDTLSPAARDLLVDVSVVGDVVVPRAFAALVAGATADVDRLLDELVARDFLRRDADVLRFSHDVVRETAYATLVRRDRAIKHLSVARWASEGDHQMGNAWWAWHATTGVDLAEVEGLTQLVEESQPLLYAATVAAGKDSLMYDNPTALRFFERALDAARPDSVDAAWVMALAGIAEHELGRFVAADEQLTRGVAGLDGESDAWRAIALGFLTSARFGLGTDFDGAVGLLREGLRDVPMSAGSMLGYAMDGVCELVKQTPAAFVTAREIAERHLAQAHALGLDDHAGTLHTVRGRARVALGDGGGIEEMVEGVELAERHDRPMLAVVARTYLSASMHHWRGPAAELAAREAMEEWAIAHNSHYVVSYSIAERVRCLAELGRWREVVALADTVDLAEAQPRWAVVERAFALHQLGELTLADVELVRRTPPASEDDLRHVLGTMLVEAIWEPGRTDELVDALGELTPYAERDGAVELLTRLIRLAPHRDYSGLMREDESTPLAAAMTPHVNGLIRRDPALLLLAAERWRSLGQIVEAERAEADSRTVAEADRHAAGPAAARPRI